MIVYNERTWLGNPDPEVLKGNEWLIYISNLSGTEEEESQKTIARFYRQRLINLGLIIKNNNGYRTTPIGEQLVKLIV